MESFIEKPEATQEISLNQKYKSVQANNETPKTPKMCHGINRIQALTIWI